MFINKYPYTDFHELNADLLIETVNDAASTAASMNTRVTDLESRANTFGTDIANLKSDMDAVEQVNDTQDTAIAGAQSSINSLTTENASQWDSIHDIDGRVISNTNRVAQAELDLGNLDTRVTALEEDPSIHGITEYLRFSTAGTPYDYDARITYNYLANLIATTASADKKYNIILVEDDEVGTTWYYALNEGEYQVSGGTPRGQFTFVCRKPVLNSNNEVMGYKVCTVTVNKNAAAPTYAEVYEALAESPQTFTVGPSIVANTISQQACQTFGGLCHVEFTMTITAPLGVGNGILDDALPIPRNGDVKVIGFNDSGDIYMLNVSSADGAFSTLYALSGTTLHVLADYAI